ncbi:MAG TPA: hypothetical protein VET26_06805 [Candidatus Sulfotelmatobacter sp.]|nr:hypothetical protein [Candidatus Sulfotelmatobacter sp.]
MPVTLESRVRQMQVFNLPHDTYCSDGDCACSDTAVVVVEENPRTGERAPRRVARKTPDSLTLLARERREGLPTLLLDVPEVRAAIARGRVRVVEQTPDAPPDKPTPAAPPKAAPVAPPATPAKKEA